MTGAQNKQKYQDLISNGMNKKHNEHEGEDVIIESGTTGSDDIELEEEEGEFKEKIARIKSELTACQKEKQEYLDGWQRAKADFLNYKRRQEEDLIRDKTFETIRFIENVLPIADSFEMAQKNKAWEEASPVWRSGIEGIQAQLANLLKDYGVEALEPLGLPFDPQFHEAIGHMQVTSDKQNEQVIEVVQKGYVINTTLVRPARVIVGTYGAADTLKN